jgi:hypothetical protein
MTKDTSKNSAPLAPTSSSAANATGAKPAKVAKALKGTLVKKTGNAKGATDPYKQAKPSRSFVTATGGARYGIKVNFQKTTAPEATSTQANGRIIAPAVNRVKPNFSDGTADYN